MKTEVERIFEQFNLLSNEDFKSWMLNNQDNLIEAEKNNFCNAFNAGERNDFYTANKGDYFFRAEDYYNKYFLKK